MITITLLQDGKDKTYTQNFVSGRKFRKTIEMQKELKSAGVDENALDKMVGYVCMLFDNQFSADNFYDGIAADKMMGTITGCINAVVKGAEKAVGSENSDPN